MSGTSRQFDVIIVGAGFAGLYMLHSCHRLGLSALVLEAGDGVGGTWYWNRYPGARCDVPSMEYSYQFDVDLQRQWKWSEKYAPQAEILAYLHHVAERFDLNKDIRLSSRVRAAHYHEDNNRWVFETDNGEKYAAQFCIFATGCLSSANKPAIRNEDLFRGSIYHTGHWPHDGVDFSGLSVAVVGTGSSAIQAIPIIAEQADSLTVFQRTPGYSVPAYNRPMDEQEQDAIKTEYAALRQRASQQFSGNELYSNPLAAREMTDEQVREECERRWGMGGLYWYGAFADLLLDEKTNNTVAEFVREKIRASIVDPAVADMLTPRTVFGCKRISTDSGYYETFNRPNVSLVDISETAIESYTEQGLKTAGQEFAFDAIVLATGFDAMTGTLDRIDIRGRNGLRLSDKWNAGPLTYLGLQTAGFPNMFIIAGPGSPSVLTNMVPSIEHHVEFIHDAMQYMLDKDLAIMEADAEAEATWVAHVNEVAASTLLVNCNSWYLGANIPGKPRVFMPYLGFPPYVDRCAQVVASGYEGFVLQTA